MRLLVPYALFLATPVAWAQGTHSEDLFRTIKPQAFIQVSKSPVGVDTVSISMLSPTYPPEILLAQVQTIGTELGQTPRAPLLSRTYLDAKNPRSVILKATFGVEGLIDRQGGELKLQPLIRAFAGVPSPNTITGMGIVFDGERPSPKTLASFSSPAVEVQRQVIPPSIEYRVHLLTQDPKAIVIPDQTTQKEKPSSSVERNGLDRTSWLLIGVAVVATGALVYSLLLMSGRRSANRPRARKH